MTVYVDRIYDYGWRLGPSCHMFVTTADQTELHEMAAKIGMKLKWFQNKQSLLHYDLTIGRRALAVANGAVEVTDRKEFCRLMNDQREARGLKRVGKL